jgi:hypothetical protein
MQSRHFEPGAGRTGDAKEEAEPYARTKGAPDGGIFFMTAQY